MTVVGSPLPVVGARGPQPKIAAQSIYERALEVVDSGGIDALTARRLAKDIRISTRTLYKRIGGHDDLVKIAAALHMARLSPQASVSCSWKAMTTEWCTSLYGQMMEHPNATALLAQHDHAHLDSWLHRLIDEVPSRGVAQDRAQYLCGLAARIAFNAAVVASRSVRVDGAATLCPPTSLAYAHDVHSAIAMILSGEPSCESLEPSCT